MENDIEVELTTGEILVFPEGTEQTTMKQALDNYLSKNPTSNVAKRETTFSSFSLSKYRRFHAACKISCSKVSLTTELATPQ